MASVSFDESLVSHRHWLQSVIRSRVREAHVVDDLVNDVLAEAVSMRQQGKETTIRELGPWLYLVAIRKILQFKRSTARRKKHEQAYSQSTVARAETTWLERPFQSLMGAERNQLVRTAIERLKGQDAEILVLKYVHGWSYLQIADHLGLNHSRVTHRLRRARGRLKAELLRLGLNEDE